MSKYLTRDTADLYLQPDIYNRADFTLILDLAEWDTINAYRFGPIYDENFVESDPITDPATGEVVEDPLTLLATVQLRYYKDDPKDLDLGNANEALFLEAMRREIADVVEHRATRDEKTLPKEFGRHLRLFELVPPHNLVG